MRPAFSATPTITPLMSPLPEPPIRCGTRWKMKLARTSCAIQARSIGAVLIPKRWQPSKKRWKQPGWRSEEHTSELQSRENLVCRLLLEKKNKAAHTTEPAEEPRAAP